MKYEKEIEKDLALHVDFLESLRMGDARILHDSEGALLVQLISWPLYLIAAVDPDEGKQLIDGLVPEEDGETMIVARGEQVVDYANHCGFQTVSPCVQVLYEQKEPIPVETELVIRHPDRTDYDKIIESYTLPISEEEVLASIEEPEFSSGYLDGKMVGYIGLHPEGSIGMLHIFDEYRGKGYGETLVKYMINRQLAAGAYPYGQVFIDNEASLAMQRKLGMTFSKDYIYWMWRKA